MLYCSVDTRTVRFLSAQTRSDAPQQNGAWPGPAAARKGFLLVGEGELRYRYAFFRQSRRLPRRLITRHRSCEDGLVLAVESCIPGGSQYKRTNTVRQIIEMKGIT